MADEVKVLDMTHADEVIHEVEGGVAPTMQSRMGTGGNQVPLVMGVFNQQGSKGTGNASTEDTCPTLGHCNTSVDVHAVAVGIDGYNQSVTGDASATISGAASDFHHTHGVALRHIVRRITPTECERLQAFPDGWTRIPYRGKPADQCPDSPRYKALGNSWATNCAEWILRRIVAAVRLGMIQEEP